MTSEASSPAYHKWQGATGEGASPPRPSHPHSLGAGLVHQHTCAGRVFPAYPTIWVSSTVLQAGAGPAQHGASGGSSSDIYGLCWQCGSGTSTQPWLPQDHQPKHGSQQHRPLRSAYQEIALPSNIHEVSDGSPDHRHGHRTSYSRTTDPDKAFTSSWGHNLTMVPLYLPVPQ